MTELRKLELKQEPNELVVRLVEELLSKAKAGYVRRIVIAAVVDYPGDPNCTSVCDAGDGPLASLIVALERAKLHALGYVESADVVPEALVR